MNKTLIEGTVCTKQGSVEYARFVAADQEDRDELATALRKLRKLLPTMSVYEVETAIDFLHRGLPPVAGRASRDAQPIRIADSPALSEEEEEINHGRTERGLRHASLEMMSGNSPEPFDRSFDPKKIQ